MEEQKETEVSTELCTLLSTKATQSECFGLEKKAWCSDLVLFAQKATLTTFFMKEWLCSFLLFGTRFILAAQKCVGNHVNPRHTKPTSKELVATKVSRCIVSLHLCLGQKTALELTTQTTANGQLACLFCVCLDNKPPDQQGEVLYIQRWNKILKD